MAKFSGVIGYITQTETTRGVWQNTVVEKPYVGDVLRDSRNWQTGDKVNETYTLNNRFSIVADPFAFANLQFIRYIKWMGASWKVTNVEVQRPRLLLTIGGQYNGV